MRGSAGTLEFGAVGPVPRHDPIHERGESSYKTDRIFGPPGPRRRTRFLALFSFAVLRRWRLPSQASRGPSATRPASRTTTATWSTTAATDFDWNSFEPVTWSPHPATTPTRQTETRPSTGSSSRASRTTKPGQLGTTADTSFAGGTKQDDNCATVVTAKPPNKDDLQRIYLASKSGADGNTFLELAWVRIPQNSPSASAHVGFEFNQGTTPCPRGLGRARAADGRRHADRLRLRGRKRRRPVLTLQEVGHLRRRARSAATARPAGGRRQT